MLGKVISSLLPYTRTILVIVKTKHKKLKKFIFKKKKYLVHDKFNNHKNGDIVKIKHCASFSKRKHWIINDTGPNNN